MRDRTHLFSDGTDGLGREAERRRLARDLHDDTAQLLLALRLEIAAIDRSLSDPDVARACLERADQLAVQALRSVREVVADLRPRELDEGGLGSAVRAHVERVAARADLDIVADMDPTDLDVADPQIAVAVFRIVQEALTNVTKHARATRVDVVLRLSDDAVEVLVNDDGVGFDEEPTTGYGLLGIRERAAALAGTVRVQSRSGAGVLLSVRIPLMMEEPAPDSV